VGSRATLNFHRLAINLITCHTSLMPKRLSKDVYQAGFQMVRRSTGTETAPSTSDISRVMSAMGRKGGKIGGKRRMVTMTPEERRAVAQKAAKARWDKAGD
jgi:hypothetical protein